MDDRVDVLPPVGKPKPAKKRKAFFRYLQKSIEFYMSDANLRRDPFMRNALDHGAEIDPSFFLSFKRVTRLAATVEDIKCALKPSSVLEFTSEGNICRKFPIMPKTNEEVDTCTLYVERIPPYADADLLTKIFSAFGKVVLVSVPKYKISNKIKGFAFVEFETPEAANAALKTFSLHGAIINFGEDVTTEGTGEIIAESEDASSGKQTEKDEAKDVNQVVQGKTEGGSLEAEKAEAKDETQLIEKKGEEESSEGIDEKVVNIHGRRKRNRKKKKSQRTSKYMGIQIMSKLAWNNLRRRYLTLQIQNRHRLKMQLSKLKKSPPHSVGITSLSSGTIVTITFPKPASEAEVRNVKTILRQLKTTEFVDIEPESVVGYVRMSSPETAVWLVNSHIFPSYALEHLSSVNEVAYWEKIKKDRQRKFSKANPTKLRGRDRLVARAERQLGVKFKLNPDE